MPIGDDLLNPTRPASTASGDNHNKPRAHNWTQLIDDIVAGQWLNPETGRYASVPYKSIVFGESLAGREAQLVGSLNLGTRFAVVADTDGYDVLGQRVAAALAPLGSVKTLVLKQPHADLNSVDALREKLHGCDAVVAVGSGTINDLCKYATYLEGGHYCVFATAASMNGYTSTTASMTLDSGLKISLPAHAPKGFFVDLDISAQAPAYLAASGFGDCLARSVAQVDWWMSHCLLGTDYWSSPYTILDEDERLLNQQAGGLPLGDLQAIGRLHRVLTLCGLGVSFTGVSNHASMAEHQISHYIDCFAGEQHPGTLHGEQVGVASLTVARLQENILASDSPPEISATQMDFDSMCQRMGVDIASQCFEEYKKKALDEQQAEAFNQKLAQLWPQLKQDVQAFMIPVSDMESLLKAAGAPTTAGELGLPVDFYHQAIKHNHEMRNRFSFVDIADGMGILEEFAETQI